jgi:hypothetical protein
MGHITNSGSRVWSGSLVIMETRLWAGQSKVWIPAGERDFSVLQNVQTGSGAHPTSCSLDTRVLSQGKELGCDVYYISPSSAKVNNDWCHTSTPPVCLHGADWDRLDGAELSLGSYGHHLVKKFSFLLSWRFLTVFTKAYHCTLSLDLKQKKNCNTKQYFT